MIDRHRLSIFLMSASLALLAGFLVLFFKNAWDEEVRALKKETGFFFVNSIRSIEGEIMDKLLTHDFMEGEGDEPQQFAFRLRNMQHQDSLKVMTFVSKKKIDVERDGHDAQIGVAASPVGNEEDEMAGSLSMIVAMTSDDGLTDSVHFSSNRPGVLALLDSNFSTSMRNAELPIDYQIIKVKSDSLSGSGEFHSGSYTDLVSGERYTAELSNYRNYIFKKTLPELLFSLGLFACVSLAFFTVFKNLKSQRRLTELKNDFIQNVTHELKTPIATVGVAIEALRKFDAIDDPARTKEYLDISKNELSRLSLLVDKVLHMSLFEQKEPVLHFETVDLRVLVEEVLASLKLQFEKREAQVSFAAEGDDFRLQGDKMHLISVVYNLLDNALKYSPEKPIIAVRLSSGANEIHLSVSDQGIGISSDHRKRIFEKFYRVPTGNAHNVKGHGLGLSYVANVVQKQGGSIQLKTAEGGGTTFSIVLPQHKNAHPHG